MKRLLKPNNIREFRGNAYLHSAVSKLATFEEFPVELCPSKYKLCRSSANGTLEWLQQECNYKFDKPGVYTPNKYSKFKVLNNGRIDWPKDVDTTKCHKSLLTYYGKQFYVVEYYIRPIPKYIVSYKWILAKRFPGSISFDGSSLVYPEHFIKYCAYIKKNSTYKEYVSYRKIYMSKYFVLKQTKKKSY